MTWSESWWKNDFPITEWQLKFHFQLQNSDFTGRYARASVQKTSDLFSLPIKKAGLPAFFNIVTFSDRVRKVIRLF